MKPIRNFNSVYGVGHCLNLGYKIIVDPSGLNGDKVKVGVFGGKDLDEYRMRVTAPQVVEPLLKFAGDRKMEIFIRDSILVCEIKNGRLGGMGTLSINNGGLILADTYRNIAAVAQEALLQLDECQRIMK